MTEQQKAPQEQGGIKSFDIQISGGSTPELDQAIESLKQIAERTPERVQLFLNGLHSLVELVRVDLDEPAAAGTGQLRVLAKPSDRFLDFLAAAGAVECDRVIVSV